MSFFPTGFNPRDLSIGMLDLVNISTPGGEHGFLLGADGAFTDVNGKVWWGSTLFSVTGLQSAIDGIAPEGAITLSYFQDPNAPDLIDQVRALGLPYLKGRDITFYVQPLASIAEMSAPVWAPIPWLKRTVQSLTFTATGAQDRSITLSFESWAADRAAARRIVLNTEGHAQIIGEANPSLEFMPTVDFQEEKLFG